MEGRQLQERLRAGEVWQDGEWVVTDELGAPVHPDWLSNLFTRRAKEAGLPRITIRQLRHSHATALLRAGAHPKVVQERLGHSSIRVTLDVYSAYCPTCNGKQWNASHRRSILDNRPIGARTLL